MSGGTGSPLLGLSFEIDNPLYIEDITAPTLSNIVLTVGEAEITLSGTVSDPASFASGNLFFRPIENPSAKAIKMYFYDTDLDENGNFTKTFIV